jgi:hypothetical protein
MVAKTENDRNIILLGTSLILRINGSHHPHNTSIGTYSFCYPYNHAMIKNGKILYELDREEETRREFFFGEQKRTYEGNQFCFCEYCDIALNKNRFPTQKDICGVLDESIAQLYAEFLKKIVQTRC